MNPGRLLTAVLLLLISIVYGSDTITIEEFTASRSNDRTIFYSIIKNSSDIAVPIIARFYYNGNCAKSVYDISAVEPGNTVDYTGELNFCPRGAAEFMLKIFSYDNSELAVKQYMLSAEQQGDSVRISPVQTIATAGERGSVTFNVLNCSGRKRQLKILADYGDGQTEEISLNEPVGVFETRLVHTDKIYNTADIYNLTARVFENTELLGQNQTAIQVNTYSSEFPDIYVRSVHAQNPVYGKNCLISVIASNPGKEPILNAQIVLTVLGHTLGTLVIDSLQPLQSKEFSGEFVLPPAEKFLLKAESILYPDEQILWNNYAESMILAKKSEEKIAVSFSVPEQNGIIEANEGQLVTAAFSAQSLPIVSTIEGISETGVKRTLFIPFDKTVPVYIEDGENNKRTYLCTVKRRESPVKLQFSPMISAPGQPLTASITFDPRYLSGSFYNTFLFQIHSDAQVENITPSLQQYAKKPDEIMKHQVHIILNKPGKNLIFASVKSFSDTSVPPIINRSPDCYAYCFNNPPPVSEQCYFQKNGQIKISDVREKLAVSEVSGYAEQSVFVHIQLSLNTPEYTAPAEAREIFYRAGNIRKSVFTDSFGEAYLYVPKLSADNTRIRVWAENIDTQETEIAVLPEKRHRTKFAFSDLKVLKGNQGSLQVILFSVKPDGTQIPAAGEEIFIKYSEKLLENSPVKTDDGGVARFNFYTRDLMPGTITGKINFKGTKRLHGTSCKVEIKVLPQPKKTELYLDNALCVENSEFIWKARITEYEKGKEQPLSGVTLVLEDENKNIWESRSRGGKAVFKIDTSKLKKGDNLFAVRFAGTESNNAGLCRAMLTVMTEKEYTEKMAPDLRLDNVFVKNGYMQEKATIVCEVTNEGLTRARRFRMRLIADNDRLKNSMQYVYVEPKKQVSIETDCIFENPGSYTVEVELSECPDELNLFNNSLKKKIEIKGESYFGKVLLDYNIPYLNGWLYKKSGEIVFMKLSGWDFRGQAYRFSVKPVNWRTTFTRFKQADDDIYELTDLKTEIRHALVVHAQTERNEIFERVDIKIHEVDPDISAELIVKNKFATTEMVSADIMFHYFDETGQTELKNIQADLYYCIFGESQGVLIKSATIDSAAWPNVLGKSRRIRLETISLNRTGKFELYAEIRCRREGTGMIRILSKPCIIEIE